MYPCAFVHVHVEISKSGSSLIHLVFTHWGFLVEPGAHPLAILDGQRAPGIDFFFLIFACASITDINNHNQFLYIGAHI